MIRHLVFEFEYYMGDEHGRLRIRDREISFWGMEWRNSDAPHLGWSPYHGNIRVWQHMHQIHMWFFWDGPRTNNPLEGRSSAVGLDHELMWFVGSDYRQRHIKMRPVKVGYVNPQNDGVWDEVLSEDPAYIAHHVLHFRRPSIYHTPLALML